MRDIVAVSVMDLWLPILLAGVFCWVASAIIHMVIKYHNADMKELSNEAEVSSAIGAGKPAPGLYHMPWCGDMSNMAKPEVQEKFNKGPVALVTVFSNGMPPMGKLLLQQFLFFIFASLLIAVVASMAFPVGSDYMSIFKLVFVLGFIAYGVGEIPFSIWYGQPWSNCLRFLIDAVIYAAVTAGTFAWLWPGIDQLVS